MKGDFTRFTFQPQKHYSSVLMQQGRLQLDADWNEQMSILNYINQTQARDLIGSEAGTPEVGNGYQILPAAQSDSSTDTAEDLRITAGRFYIDGILCELNLGTSIPVEWQSSSKIQVPTLILDGLAFEKDQWIELTASDAALIQCKISQVNPDDFTLNLDRKIDELQAKKPITLRRLTTYKTQADYPNPEPLLSKESIYLVYLDAWQRHVTALDDRTLQEVALNGLDTTTRLQTIAQVKLLDITKDLEDLEKNSRQTKSPINLDFDSENQVFNKTPSLPNLKLLPTWNKLTSNSALMNATTASDPKDAIDTSGNYLGGDNRLYRVEIHQQGAIDQATFKWSRDNGSIVSAIEKIEGDVVHLKGSIQDEYKLFSADSQVKTQDNPWVEIISEAQELTNQITNQSVIFVQIRDVKPPNLLFLDMSQVQGGTLPQVDSQTAEQSKLKIRRWDGQINTSSEWQILEQGIRVQFSSDNASFKTGDFWLIPVRADRPIDWIRDLPQAKQQLGNPIAQPPIGIQHRYGILAVVKAEGAAFKSVVKGDDPTLTLSDLRRKFLPLVDRGNTSGFDSPEARLYVKGNEETRTGKISKIGDNPPKIEISEAKALILRGYTISINGETAVVTNVENNGDLLRLTLNKPIGSLSSTPQSLTFSYRQPIVRFETNGSTVPQFFLDDSGNIGINTFTPTAKLEIKGIMGESAIDLFQVKDAAEKSLVKVQPNGKVGIGIDLPQASLDVRDTLRVSTDSTFLQIQSPIGNQVLFTSSPSNESYSFDQKIIVKNGGITVQNNGGANISGLISAQNGLTIASGGMTVNGRTAFIGEVTIKTAATDTNNRITVSSSETAINGNVTLSEGNLSIFNGTLTVDGFTTNDTMLQFSKAATFTEDITVRENLILPQKKLSLTDGNNQLVVLSTFQAKPSSPNSRLHVAGNVAIGTSYNDPSLGLTDGLLVAGRIGIGSFKAKDNDKDREPELSAKLEVQGETNGNKDGALNITAKNHKSLLYVRNDGHVWIATQQEAPSTETIQALKASADAQNAKLYVEGNAYINGNLFAQKIEGSDIVQTSSRTLKENITTLSTQEATALLEQLNPVKFTYIQTTDSTLHTGFIAEDVPELLSSPDRQAVRVLDIVAVLTKTVKDHRKALVQLNSVIKQQQAAIAALTEKVNRLGD